MADTAVAPVATPNADATRAVEAVMAEMYAGWTARNPVVPNALLSKDARIVLWGTDRGEQIIGQAKADLSPWLALCPPWRSIVPTRHALAVGDDLAYVVDDAEGTWQDGGAAHTAHYRVTCVLQREEGGWRLIHTHFSNPTE